MKPREINDNNDNYLFYRGVWLIGRDKKIALIAIAKLPSCHGTSCSRPCTFLVSASSRVLANPTMKLIMKLQKSETKWKNVSMDMDSLDSCPCPVQYHQFLSFKDMFFDQPSFHDVDRTSPSSRPARRQTW